MFLTGGQAYYTKDGGQKTKPGDFLCLVENRKLDVGPHNFRACVVKTHLEQCGQWMMGRCKIQGHEFSLSGSYGGDGLPFAVPEEVFKKCVPVPLWLHELWDIGGGHNSCGSESLPMQKWAQENIKELRKAARKM